MRAFQKIMGLGCDGSQIPTHIFRGCGGRGLGFRVYGGGRGGMDFFHFSLIPTKFLSSFQWVFIRLSLCSPSSQCALLHVLPSTSLLSHMFFGKCCLPFTYIGGPQWKNFILQNKTFYFGELRYFHFFGVMGQSNWLIAKKKNWTWEAPRLSMREGSLLVLTIGKKLCIYVGFRLWDTILAHSLANVEMTSVHRMKIFRWV